MPEAELNQWYESSKQYCYISTMRLILLTLLVLLFLGCPAPPGEELEAVDPLSEVQFTYLDTQEALYFAAKVAGRYQQSNLDTAGVLWYGTSGLSGTADTLYLNDNGITGDILSTDGIYGLKVANNSLVINNSLAADDSGLVYLTCFARYTDSTATVTDSFHLGNLVPVVLWAELDTSGIYVSECVACPDTDYVIIRPGHSGVELVPVSARISEPNGYADISWVGFTSMHVGPDTLLNRGNLIYLYDDGSAVELYPGLTSGDETAGDGIYTFAIPIYGTGYTLSQTKTGLFRWSFQAGDLSGERSNIYNLQVKVE